MPAKQILVLNAKQIQQKIDRIAYQIYEDNFEEKEIVLAGVVARGYMLAQRLKAVIEKVSPIKVSLLKIEVDKDASTLQSNVDGDVALCANKVIIIVDDVLNSGRTLAYALAVFVNIPLKKVRTVALIDRNHKSFPVASDFIGLSISTVLQEHVSVIINPTEQLETDAVYLS